jgi:hypothetical protein
LIEAGEKNQEPAEAVTVVGIQIIGVVRPAELPATSSDLRGGTIVAEALRNQTLHLAVPHEPR